MLGLTEYINEMIAHHNNKELMKKVSSKFRWSSDILDKVKVSKNIEKEKPVTNKIPEDVQHILLQGMTAGYWHVFNYNGKDYDFGVSRENILSLCKGDEYDYDIDALKDLIKEFEDMGYKFKYETNKEFLKAGFVDPETIE